MISFFYDLALLFFCLANIPKLLMGRYRASLSARFGWKLPPPSNKKKVIWMHAVSVGESKALSPLFHALRKKEPTAAFFISSTTATGHEEARRSLPEADGYFFLPLDFSWIMKKLVQTLRPNLLILSEGDFWYHLLKESKKRGARCLLVNGKISARSASRFAKVSLFSKPLFRLLDHCCVQSFRYAERFYTLGIEKKKIAITGNLKLDSAQKSLTLEEKKEWKERLGATGRLIVIGSTHPKEEELLIAALKPLFAHFPDLKVVVAPRHPERFAALRAQFKEYGEQAILIDRMGILHELYQIADIAIVAGSFVPGARGHNIFEPMQFGIPTLFGSYMDSQLDLVALALDEQAAIQSSLHDLEKNILTLLQEKEKREALSERALRLSQEARGASLRTVNILESYLV